MTTRLFFLVLLLGSFQWSVAQNEHFNWLGLNEMPSPTDSIESLPYSGQANDFSGGYNVGDTISDFHLWTLQGEEFLLSNEGRTQAHDSIQWFSYVCSLSKRLEHQRIPRRCGLDSKPLE